MDFSKVKEYCEKIHDKLNVEYTKSLGFNRNEFLVLLYWASRKKYIETGIPELTNDEFLLEFGRKRVMDKQLEELLTKKARIVGIKSDSFLIIERNE